MADSSPPAAVPATAAALAARYQTTYTRELSPGVVVELKKLPLTDHILTGKLPNEVLRHLRFDGGDAFDTRDESQVEAERFAAYEAIMSRALVNPKYKHSKYGPPDPAKNEAGPANFSYIEMQNAYYFIVKEVAPLEPPFPAGQPVGGGTGEPGPFGAALPDAPEPLSGTDGHG